ncbi:MULTISPECIES: hypothetical protein [Acinetobacter]|uniref:Uncharacterized protein n=1 Tax=Acinetobacter pseudolwoffii TaxID=2053287 RepID=N9MAE0_9GAMM|nr:MULTISPECIES: hypothetical protein [Acinetobacter]ENW87314.1 hypothetical protein F906_00539 [Acinetobacter pseudolwoffii]MDM1335944.1 hypothetical protein [Acinetobacter pseudolwoffii]MDM1342763.1 hypothetical protein [Acinetobacter pseudolwoffii]PJI29396.1 hypothetical protein CU478_09480 [Acinetobacter pseudolwoffii]
MKKALLSSMVVGMCVFTPYSFAMTTLNDEELSDVEGQALLSMEVQRGYNQADDLGTNYDQSNISFYKLGLEAEMEINTNIKKLQLGCGGINGATGCDIDIDHIALSGLPTNSNYTSNDRAGSSALITNPFLQFAIKNPNQASTREVLGFRLSAEKIQGLLTLGTENSNTPNGINSFSGYMKTKAASGVANTASRIMDYAATGQMIEGTVRGKLGSLTLPLDLHYKSDDYSFTLQESTAPFTIPATIVSGTRMKEVVLKGTGTVDRIDFNGPLEAQLLGGLLNLDKEITGYLTGLKTDITVNQNLGLIHALYLNNPASLSLQSQKILWPGAAVGANQGWWMSMEDEVDLGSISPTDKVQITDAVLKQTIAGINHDLTNNIRICGGIISGCIAGGSLDVSEIKNPTLIDFPLNNLKLAGQNFQPNCFGGHKFC